jgi:MerR family transcriptional regulator, Zn(II)-responsive regulator of zntA
MPVTRQPSATAPRADGITRDLRSGELAKIVGVSTDTLRHYERKGVLEAPRRLANGYRAYSAGALVRVRTVRAALALGFTLDELSPLFRARAGGRPPCRAVRDLAAAKLADAEAQLAELARLVETLRSQLAAWDERLSATPRGEPARLLESLLPSPPSRRKPKRRGAP